MRCNVLITAGSRRVPLVRAFQRALHARAPGSSVIVSDVNPLSPAVYAADRAHRVPLSSDPGYLDAIGDLCRREDVALVVPTIDDELTLFAERAPAFTACGVRVAVSPPETTLVCDDKFSTCTVLREHGIDAVETFLPGQMPDSPEFPLFIKPRVGRGGVGAFAVRTRRELDFFLEYVPDPVVQRYLDSPEFTIDMLCDFDGRPLAIVPRERVVVRAGVVDRGRTLRDPALIKLALDCARALRFVGAVNIQCRFAAGKPVVFEINPRFSGGIPLTIAAGADFPRMLVDLTVGRSVSTAIGLFEDNLWMSNYEASVFLAASQVGFSADRATGAMDEVA